LRSVALSVLQSVIARLAGCEPQPDNVKPAALVPHDSSDIVTFQSTAGARIAYPPAARSPSQITPAPELALPPAVSTDSNELDLDVVPPKQARARDAVTPTPLDSKDESSSYEYSTEEVAATLLGIRAGPVALPEKTPSTAPSPKPTLAADLSQSLASTDCDGDAIQEDTESASPSSSSSSSASPPQSAQTLPPARNAPKTRKRSHPSPSASPTSHAEAAATTSDSDSEGSSASPPRPAKAPRSARNVRETHKRPHPSRPTSPTSHGEEASGGGEGKEPPSDTTPARASAAPDVPPESTALALAPAIGKVESRWDHKTSEQIREEYRSQLLGAQCSAKRGQIKFTEKEATEMTSFIFDDLVGPKGFQQLQSLISDYAKATDSRQVNVPENVIAKAELLASDSSVPESLKPFFNAFWKAQRLQPTNNTQYHHFMGEVWNIRLNNAYRALVDKTAERDPSLTDAIVRVGLGPRSGRRWETCAADYLAMCLGTSKDRLVRVCNEYQNVNLVVSFFGEGVIPLLPKHASIRYYPDLSHLLIVRTRRR
jgi:hypothetical protein